MSMVRIFALIVFSSIPCTTASAQYGSAPNNYYPDNYSGSTFTGEVTATSGDQITLIYKKKDKTDTFIGRFETNCSVPSKDHHAMVASDIPAGTVLTAFYDRESKKVNGQKEKENVIIAIAFDVWQGQKVNDDKKLIYSCSKSTHMKFRAWGN
jgi:hypothetical protein